MPPETRAVTGGQFVTDDKRQFARHLRHEMTPQEAKVWQAVRGRRLGGFKFRRQQVIDGFIADFYCAEVGVVIELDGPVHDDQAEYDANRDRVIAERRITVVRVRNERIDNELAAALREVEEVCRRLAVGGGPHPRPPLHEWRGGVQDGYAVGASADGKELVQVEHPLSIHGEGAGG